MEAHTATHTPPRLDLAAVLRALSRPLARHGRTPAALAPCSRHLARAQLAHAPPVSMLSQSGAYSAAAPLSLVSAGRSGRGGCPALRLGGGLEQGKGERGGGVERSSTAGSGGVLWQCTKACRLGRRARVLQRNRPSTRRAHGATLSEREFTELRQSRRIL